MSEKVAIRKVRAKLKQPDVRAALRDAFEAASGFTEAEALALHVAHIRGFPRAVQTGVDAFGNAVVEVVTDRPNYAALKDYEAMALPKKPEERRVQVDSRVMNMHVPVSGLEVRGGPPPVRPRSLGDGGVPALMVGNE